MTTLAAALSSELESLLFHARAAKAQVACLDTMTKNAALHAMALELEAQTPKILAANELDLQAAQGNISSVMLDRLALSEARIKAMAAGIEEVIALTDPVGRILEETTPQPGLFVQKVSVPMGVVAIIYESRPNVTADAAALAVKSGNVCVLRSGKEALRSASAIVDALKAGLKQADVTPNAINLVTDGSRASASALMTATQYIDLLIPRGGAGLIRSCVENATVPVIATGTGICHVYVDAEANLDQALRIVNNAKTSRPSVCNAEEVLLVHSAVASEFLSALKRKLIDERTATGLTPVELRVCERAAQIIDATPATPADFDTEFLDYTLAVKVVDSTEEAVAHIAQHSTGHSDAIITNNEETATYFTRQVDSAAVYVNASTRFTDGGMFGLGCEIGISTQKLHARGPMGLRELTTYKYIVRGDGAIRE